MSEQLKHKLFDYHAQPPANAWNKLNNSLNENSDHRVSERLLQYEVNPPDLVWNNISASLNENEKPVAPFKIRFLKPLKYATVAAALISIVVLVSLFANRNPVSEDVAISPVINQNMPTPVLPADTEKQTETFVENNGFNKSHEMVYTNNIKPSHRALPLYTESSFTPFTELTDQVVRHNYPIETSVLLDRYIIFSKSSGDAFRLSRKLYHLFKCSDTDENCKENIEAIQQRMADPALMASADFSGVLDLIKNMNKQ